MSKNFCLFCDNGEQIPVQSRSMFIRKSPDKGEDKALKCYSCGARYWWDLGVKLSSAYPTEVDWILREPTDIPEGALFTPRSERIL